MLKAIGPTMRNRMMRQGGRASVKASMEWDVIDHQGLYLIRNDTCCILTGHCRRFSKITTPLTSQIDKPDFAAITVVSLDGKPLSPQSRKILITACGRCENTGMVFAEDRRTVGRNWGKAPVQIEPVEGLIQLPSFSGNTPMTCKVLSPNGTIKEQFTIKNGLIPLKAEYGTMWYLIERAEPKHPGRYRLGD